MAVEIGQSLLGSSEGDKQSREAQLGPVGIRLAHPIPSSTKVSPGVSLTQGLTQAHAAQGGVTLGPEQGELGGEFLLSWANLDAAPSRSQKDARYTSRADYILVHAVEYHL